MLRLPSQKIIEPKKEMLAVQLAVRNLDIAISNMARIETEMGPFRAVHRIMGIPISEVFTLKEEPPEIKLGLALDMCGLITFLCEATTYAGRD